ncbi:unnamed protein product [Prunus brigantina]
MTFWIPMKLPIGIDVMIIVITMSAMRLIFGRSVAAVFMVRVSKVPAAYEASSMCYFSSWLTEAYAWKTDRKGFIRRIWPQRTLQQLTIDLVSKMKSPIEVGRYEEHCFERTIHEDLPKFLKI